MVTNSSVCIAFLARHGETDWNRERRWQGQTNTRLNAQGHRQATELGRLLASRGITRVHASDLLRALETAEIVAQALGIGPVTMDPDLRERNFGCFEGLTFPECEQRYPEMWDRYRADRTLPIGAESDEVLVARMTRGVERATAQEGTALVVAHGSALRAYLRSMGIGRKDGDDFGFANGAAIRVEIVRGAQREPFIRSFDPCK